MRTRIASPRRRPGALRPRAGRPTLDAYPPRDLLGILRSVQSASPDPRLEPLLDAFRRQWLAIARVRYAGVPDVEDAVQDALCKIVAPARLARLNDTTPVVAWARTVFVNTVMDRVRERARHERFRVHPGVPGDDPEVVLRTHLPAPDLTPEDAVASAERIAIILRCIDGIEAARLRFLDEVPEGDIAVRLQRSRDAVAGQLKRVRQRLRLVLGRSPHPSCRPGRGRRVRRGTSSDIARRA